MSDATRFVTVVILVLSSLCATVGTIYAGATAYLGILEADRVHTAAIAQQEKKTQKLDDRVSSVEVKVESSSQSLARIETHVEWIRQFIERGAK